MLLFDRVFSELLEEILTYNFLGIEVGFVAIGNPERHMRKASHRGSKQQ